MGNLLAELLSQLHLETLETDHYQGQSQDLGWGRVYGGQVLGQALVAATNTVTGRPVHSMHAYFLRPGDVRAPITYEVERVRDGGSFSMRRVAAKQFDKQIFVMTASFQTRENGLEHQIEMPKIPGPEGILSELDLRRQSPDRFPESVREKFTRDRPIEIRTIDPVDLDHPEKKPPVKYSWIRALGEMPEDPTLNKCLLAYMSDWGILGTSLLPHGMTVSDPKLQMVSLDHAMWFHREFKANDWLLYAQESPSSSQGRGFSRGNVFTREGKLVASVCQEGLVRWKG
jgi:acyl-CoA thioesterase-2